MIAIEKHHFVNAYEIIGWGGDHQWMKLLEKADGKLYNSTMLPSEPANHSLQHLKWANLRTYASWGDKKKNYEVFLPKMEMNMKELKAKLVYWKYWWWATS